MVQRPTATQARTLQTPVNCRPKGRMQRSSLGPKNSTQPNRYVHCTEETLCPRLKVQRDRISPCLFGVMNYILEWFLHKKHAKLAAINTSLVNSKYLFVWVITWLQLHEASIWCWQVCWDLSFIHISFWYFTFIILSFISPIMLQIGISNVWKICYWQK